MLIYLMNSNVKFVNNLKYVSLSFVPYLYLSYIVGLSLYQHHCTIPVCYKQSDLNHTTYKHSRVPTASYKSYNLTRCPIFVLYLCEEGICPIFSLKMSHKSYNLGLLSYNYFQIHVQPAY